MTFYLTIDDEESPSGEHIAYCDDSPTARISTEKENGESCRGPLSWLNSARISIDEADDAVHFVASVDDPRGGLCFTIRRTPNGRLLIHQQEPCEPNTRAINVDGLKQVSPSTLVVTDSSGAERDFSDDPPDACLVSRDDCERMLLDVCIDVSDDESVETLREAVEGNVGDGTIDPDTFRLAGGELG